MKLIETCINRTLITALIVGSFVAIANAQSVTFVGDFSYMTVGTIRPVRLQVQNGPQGNSIEIFLVKATSGGELTNGLGFSFNMFNGPYENEFIVRVNTDSFGNGYSDQFYMKSIAAVSPVTVSTCGGPYNSMCVSRNLGPPPSGGGTNTNPPPSVTAIGVDEIVQYWLVTPQPVEPAFRGYTVRFSIQPNNSVGVARSQSSSTWGASIGVDMYIDSNGHGRSETFYLKGLKKTNSNVYLPASSDNHFIAESQAVPIKVAQVTLLKWVSYVAEHPIDDNPLAAGGGSRHFADKNTVYETDASNWRKVGIQVQVSPSVPNMVVRVKAFDVDDPSSSTEIDPNGASGNDNREAAPSYTANLTTDGTGTAFGYYWISSRPGDNYRLAATVSSQTLTSTNPLRQKFDSITTYSLDGTRLRVPDGSVLAVWSPTTAVATDEEFLSSPMLTIWRRLHIERDSMGTIKNNRITTSMGAIRRDRVLLKTVLELDASKPNLMPDQLNGGRILYQDSDVTGIFDNIILGNTERTITVRGHVPDTFDEFGDTAVLFDDDDFNSNDIDQNGDEMEDVPNPDVGMLQASDSANLNVLAAACIRPVYDLIGEQGDVAFVANSRSVADFDNIASEGDMNFWTIYAITAYQGDVSQDCDPNGEYCGAYQFLGTEGIMFFIETYFDSASRVSPLPEDKTYRALWAEAVGRLFDRDVDLVPNEGQTFCTPNPCVNFTPASIAMMRSALNP